MLKSLLSDVLHQMLKWAERALSALLPRPLAASVCADLQLEDAENRTVLLTRPEDVLDPGDGAAGVSAAGSGASGWCSVTQVLVGRGQLLTTASRVSVTASLLQ